MPLYLHSNSPFQAFKLPPLTQSNLLENKNSPAYFIQIFYLISNMNRCYTWCKKYISVVNLNRQIWKHKDELKCIKVDVYLIINLKPGSRCVTFTIINCTGLYLLSGKKEAQAKNYIDHIHLLTCLKDIVFTDHWCGRTQSTIGNNIPRQGCRGIHCIQKANSV